MSTFTKSILPVGQASDDLAISETLDAVSRTSADAHLNDGSWTLPIATFEHTSSWEVGWEKKRGYLNLESQHNHDDPHVQRSIQVQPRQTIPATDSVRAPSHYVVIRTAIPEQLAA